MTWGNVIAGTVVVLMLAGAVVAIIRQRKHGGCAGCSGCDCTHSCLAKKQPTVAPRGQSCEQIGGRPLSHGQ